MHQPTDRLNQHNSQEIKVYSLFQTINAIELRLDSDRIDYGRLICSRKDYKCILDVGYRLAKVKGLQFIDRIASYKK